MTDLERDRIARIRKAYDKVALWPEENPEGWAHMLNLRQAVAELLKIVPDA